MFRIGVVPLLAIALFGIAIPFGAYRISRRIGLLPLLAMALAIGFGYGALKAENPWSGPGLSSNLALMGASGLALLAYVAAVVGAASLVAKAVSRARS